MNAATILKFFNQKKNYQNLIKKKFYKLLNSIGSDVILGINPMILQFYPQMAIIKKFFKTPKFNILLVRPNFGCSTKKIYSGVKRFGKPQFNVP